jgi:hypothetical protein
MDILLLTSFVGQSYPSWLPSKHAHQTILEKGAGMVKNLQFSYYFCILDFVFFESILLVFICTYT